MLELANLQPAYLTEEHIGFVLGPRLNALGRLDDANPAVELLTTTDAGRARVLATHLEGLNARRRLLTAQVLRGALAQIEKNPDLLEQAALVLAHPEWPARGDRHRRQRAGRALQPPDHPALDAARAARARLGALDRRGATSPRRLPRSKALLLGFGGHPMAAGLSLDPANLPAFRRGLSRYVEKALGGAAPPRPPWRSTGTITLADLIARPGRRPGAAGAVWRRATRPWCWPSRA